MYLFRVRQGRNAAAGGNEDAQHGDSSQRANSMSLRLNGEVVLL